MKDKILKLMILILTLMVIIYDMLIEKQSWMNLIYMVALVLLIIIVNSLYHFVIGRKNQITTKKVIMSYSAIYSVAFVISLMIHNDFANLINIFINYFSLLSSSLLVYVYCRRKYKALHRSLLAILSIFIVFTLLVNLSNNCLLILPSLLFLINIANYVDASSLFRKKNIFYYGISILVLSIGFVFNKLIVLSLIPLFEKVSRGDKKSYIIRIGFLVYVLVLFLLIPNEFSNIFQVNQNILLCADIFFLFEFIFAKDLNANKDLLIIILLYFIFLLIFNLDVSYQLAILPLMMICVYSKLDKLRFKIYVNIKRMPKTIKKVSAVVPNYNYADYLDERIDSIVNQIYPIYELIILDDCSKDNSVEVIKKKLKEINDKYPNIKTKFIPNKINSGNVFKQWKKCFELSTGDYLWICEADDSCSKYFLNNVMRGFDSPQVVLSYSESKTIDEFGRVLKKDLRDWIDIFETDNWYSSYIHNGKYELKNFLCTNNTIANVSGVVFKKDKKIQYEKYLTDAQKYVLSGDWYFYSKVLLFGDISYCSMSLNYHRMHSKSVTLTTDNFVHFQEIKSIQKSIMKDVSLSIDAKKRIKTREMQLKKNLCISEDEIYYSKLSLRDLIHKKKIKDDVLLSIVIPVYNVEQYLDKCLKSIFKDLPIKTEVLIINDGSPDNSEEIILKYMAKHKELKYIKKKNGGLSSVKNRGLKEARGKYIIFLDSDDYVSSNMYSTMLKKAIDKDLDMVYCDILMTFDDGSIQYCSMKNYSRKDKKLQILDTPLMASSPNKMIKKELYDGLTFPEGMNNEDVAVSPIVIARCKKIDNIPSPFYKYVQREGSIQNSGFNEKRFVIFDTVYLCVERVRDFDKYIQDIVIGTLLTHQLLAVLVYLISDEKDSELRFKYIDIFCRKYEKFNLYNDNIIVNEYLKGLGLSELLKYISACNIKKIDSLIRKSRV